MKILIIGGSGYIGHKLFGALKKADLEVVSASRRPTKEPDTVQLDTTDQQALTLAIAGFDVVVNCVAGNYKSIATGAKVLVEASKVQTTPPRIVHLSSMAVYGRYEGVANEKTALDPSLGWYASAKCEAEAFVSGYAESGGEVVVLRPGCVYDAHSYLWVERIASWLKQGRLGDIGTLGDGWSNLVHVDDVIQAIVAAINIELPASRLAIFNLAAPDAPRWNEYFKDLALVCSATPLKRVRAEQLWLDTKLVSPPIKIAELLLKRLLSKKLMNVFPFPAPLLSFFSQQIQLDSTLASSHLLKSWVSYSQGLKEISERFHANFSKPNQLY